MLTAPLPSLSSSPPHHPKIRTSKDSPPNTAETADFRAAVLEGLSGEPRTLPCRFFYDREGSLLFDAICEQPEYYLTRTEDEILRSCSVALASLMPAGVSLVELGSGT